MNSALRRARAMLGAGIRRNVLGTAHPRRALLMYQVASFRPGVRITHQNIGQARELTRAIGERDYDVDVVNYDERRRRLLQRDYDLVIDLHPSERPLYEGRLAPGARRACYITGANPAVGNAAERARLDDLARRRGVRLQPRRQSPPFPRAALESCDAMFLIGGSATRASYAEFRLPPCQPLVNNGYDDVRLTDFARRRPRRFLFLASTGQVHKGLDLLLELFAARSDLELVVCSMYQKERDFVRAYRRELFEMPNIRAAGFVEVRSPRFAELQAECGAMILPSCSEGQSGTVTSAMSYGLPPIVSRECGFDDPELETLPDCRPETLERVVSEWAARPAAWVAERSRLTLELMRRRYRPEHYAAQVRSGLDRLLSGAPAGVAAGRDLAPGGRP